MTGRWVFPGVLTGRVEHNGRVWREGTAVEYAKGLNPYLVRVELPDGGLTVLPNEMVRRAPAPVAA